MDLQRGRCMQFQKFRWEGFLGGLARANGVQMGQGRKTHSPIATRISGFSKTPVGQSCLGFKNFFFRILRGCIGAIKVQLDFVNLGGKFDECKLSIRLDLEIMHYRCQEGLEHERRVVESGDPTSMCARALRFDFGGATQQRMRHPSPLSPPQNH